MGSGRAVWESGEAQGWRGHSSSSSRNDSRAWWADAAEGGLWLK